MAHIPYLPDEDIPESDRVPDRDHILRIHGVHPATMRLHYELYIELGGEDEDGSVASRIEQLKK